MGNLLKYLSFKGRANRQRFWLTALAIWGIIFGGAMVSVALTGVSPFLAILFVPIYLAAIVASLANSARRLHDRSKSAWWLLVFVGLPVLVLLPAQVLSAGGGSAASAAFGLICALLSLLTRHRIGFHYLFLIFALVLTVLALVVFPDQVWLLGVITLCLSIGASAAIGYGLSQATEGANQALWEGILGLVAIVLVASLLVHMRRIAPKLKQTMHQKLDEAKAGRSGFIAMAGVFLFTALMITREGMETALLLLQIHGALLTGALLGLAAAAALAVVWAKYSHLINMSRFFQVTNLFLVLFQQVSGGAARSAPARVRLARERRRETQGDEGGRGRGRRRDAGGRPQIFPPGRPAASPR